MDTKENIRLGRASYTADERRELIDEFISSGMTQAVFCREWNIKANTLSRWLRNERKQNEMSFCEVALPDLHQTDAVRIVLPNKIEVMLQISSLKDLGAILREVNKCLD